MEVAFRLDAGGDAARELGPLLLAGDFARRGEAARDALSSSMSEATPSDSAAVACLLIFLLPAVRFLSVGGGDFALLRSRSGDVASCAVGLLRMRVERRREPMVSSC